MIFNNERIIHSIKTALAVLIGYIITQLSPLPLNQWLIITIIVVMCAQMNVGSLLQKSIMRFFGTLTGSIFAAISIFLFGNNVIATGSVITLSVLYFSYLATGSSKFNEAGTLGAATAVIILLGQNPTLTTAYERTIEIVLGIVIATLISQFVLPIHARSHLRRNQISTFKQLHELYEEYFLQKKSFLQEDPHKDELIVKSLIAQRKLALDATREPLAKNKPIVKHFSNMLYCEREILRSINFMHHAFLHSKEGIKIFSSELMLKDFHEKMAEAFKNICAALQSQQKTSNDIIIPTLQPIRNAIREDQANLTEDDAIYANAFLFCAEILVERMQDLVNLIKK